MKAEEQSQEKLGALAVRYAPPWLISTVFHMAALIVLALMVLPSIAPKGINLTAIYAERLGAQLEFDSPFAGNDETLIEEPIFTPDDLEWVDNPFAAPPDVDVFFPHATSAVSKVDAVRIGMALRGRSEGSRQSLLAAYGGDATTEAAVGSGLAWLKSYQRSNGSWSLKGRYPNGALDENMQAATAMALLAFQGNGHTHREGKYAEEVDLAWKWLLKEQGEDGSFFQQGYYNHRFYTQGLCAIAICELYGMSGDESFKEPAQKAIGYCLRNQGSQGGWRYYPLEDDDPRLGAGDVSVTGWILMALQSARMAGLEIPPDHFRRAGEFLDQVAVDDGSRYRYQPDRTPSRAMTAEGLLCRQYLGWERDDPRLIEGVKWLTLQENLIDYRNDRDVYYWYYATQVMHHMEGEYWERWNKVMRQALPTEQVKIGRQKGSWDPNKPRRDEWGGHGGRLFVTCLSIYMLEVYYRHLPLYSSPYGRLSGF